MIQPDYCGESFCTNPSSASAPRPAINPSGDGMTTFRNWLFSFFLLTLSATTLLLAIGNSPAALAQSTAQASIDRDVVSEGDSLTLIISVDGNADDEPDYSALKKDFDLFGNSQSTQHSLSNGRLSSHTEWQTTLIPKRSGALTIPPIAVGAITTQALTIQVNPASKNNANDGSDPVFVETQIDRDSVYVQQQLLFTVRVFASVSLENLHLTKPDFDNATIKQISETTFRRDINDTPYAVHELTYVIFPQQSGELTIPELVCSAVEVARSRSLFDFPGQGRAVRRLSKQLHVHVKPIPKSFSGNVWLPARNLTLTESWDGNPQRLVSGESITRHIGIRADGVLAARLPAIEPLALANAKIYADQPTLDDKQDASGTHGKRVENMALIPTQAGALHLPETKIVWWDIDSDREKTATLSAQSLQIIAGTAAANQPTAQPAATTANTAPLSSSPTSAMSSDIDNNGTALLLRWQLLSGVLLLLWLLTVFLYWRSRRLGGTTSIDKHTPDTLAASNEQHAWQLLINACRNNEPAAARQALLQWSRLYFNRPTLRSIDQLHQLYTDETLTRELQQLDNRLFGTLPDSGEWNGETFLQVITNLQNQRSTIPKTTAQLPPLYPVT
jgi:hypothetical protein